jgi:hypothetical protein
MSRSIAAAVATLGSHLPTLPNPARSVRVPYPPRRLSQYACKIAEYAAYPRLIIVHEGPPGVRPLAARAGPLTADAGQQPGELGLQCRAATPQWDRP